MAPIPALHRMQALIVKEFLAILRDPRGRMILIVPPVVQLLIFSFAATFDVTNISVLILDRDHGYWGSELIHRVRATPVMGTVRFAQSEAAVRSAIDSQDVIAVIEIGPTFSRDIEAGNPASVQIILDGRRSNTAQIVAGYLSQIVSTLSADTPAGPRLTMATVDVESRNWFNPALLSRWAMVPGLIGIIALLTGLVVTALSVARERESGTFDQLMVSPLRTHEILIGKMTPPMIVGLLQVTLFIVVAVFIFGIPLRGSLLSLYFGTVIYLIAVVGLGLFISALSATQQQAILGAFLAMVPMIMLSGFATPIDNMPDWLQPVTLIDPLRYYLVIVRGVFLRALPFDEVLANIWPLVLIACVTLTSAAWLFRSRLE
ncbi:MAG: ABC transporter permease [Alphaproteobacteria bacterium]|nr:ABC transporter permease [Alphaproteobacteria bacterium]